MEEYVNTHLEVLAYICARSFIMCTFLFNSIDIPLIPFLGSQSSLVEDWSDWLLED